jgi:hypothetical protein
MCWWPNNYLIWLTPKQDPDSGGRNLMRLHVDPELQHWLKVAKKLNYRYQQFEKNWSVFDWSLNYCTFINLWATGITTWAREASSGQCCRSLKYVQRLPPEQWASCSVLSYHNLSWKAIVWAMSSTNELNGVRSTRFSPPPALHDCATPSELCVPLWATSTWWPKFHQS